MYDLEMLNAYKKTVAGVEAGTDFVTHVGVYSDKVIIVVRKTRADKSVQVVDCTPNPENDHPDPEAPKPAPQPIDKPATSGHQPKPGSSPDKPVDPPKPPPKVSKGAMVCKKCGKVYKRKDAFSKHKEDCNA